MSSERGLFFAFAGISLIELLYPLARRGVAVLFPFGRIQLSAWRGTVDRFARGQPLMTTGSFRLKTDPCLDPRILFPPWLFTTILHLMILFFITFLSNPTASTGSSARCPCRPCRRPADTRRRSLRCFSNPYVSGGFGPCVPSGDRLRVRRAGCVPRGSSARQLPLLDRPPRRRDCPPRRTRCRRRALACGGGGKRSVAGT